MLEPDLGFMLDHHEVFLDIGIGPGTKPFGGNDVGLEQDPEAIREYVLLLNQECAGDIARLIGSYRRHGNLPAN